MRAYELLEYKTDITQQKYDAVLKQISPDASILQKIEQADPTKNKQYVLWIIKQLQSKLIRVEDLNRVLQALTNFDQLKPRLPAEQRDIGRMTIHQLEAVVDAAMGTETTDEFKLDIPGAKVLYNGPLGTLVIPESKEAACELGKGTKWCTSADEFNMFDGYNDRGPLYIWKDKTGKYQFHFETYSLMDSHDVPLEQDKIDEFRRHPVLKKLFDENYDEEVWRIATQGEESFIEQAWAAEGAINALANDALTSERLEKLTNLSNYLSQNMRGWVESGIGMGYLENYDDEGANYDLGEDFAPFSIFPAFDYAGVYPQTLINIATSAINMTDFVPELKNKILQWLKSFKPTSSSITL